MQERRPVLGREQARRVDHEVHGEVRELARATVGVARRRRVHEPDLCGGGQVRVAPALPLCGVVLEVVPAEHAGERQQNRQVGEDRAGLVAARAGRDPRWCAASCTHKKSMWCATAPQA